MTVFAVIVADSCRLVEEGSFFWWLWGCWISPYVIVVLCSSLALACAALHRRPVRMSARWMDEHTRATQNAAVEGISWDWDRFLKNGGWK